VQRLFATFPDGRQGFALLILRLSLAAFAAYGGAATWCGPGAGPILAVVAFFLATGLFVPYVSIAATALGSYTLLDCRADLAGKLFLLTVLAATGLLGAGAYSVDSYLFGRRQVVFPKRNS
jgi:hypothetical protein